MHRGSPPKALTFALLLAAAGAARAAPAPAAPAPAPESDVFRFMEEEARVITVASVTPETVYNSVSNVTVIDREAIERYGFQSVAEALQTVAGVMVWRTFSMQHIPIFRGALQENFANKVLVMIDNVPAWHAVTGEGDIDRVGIDSIERIEILRGPASVLYGSNALNGAINIVLRTPRRGSSLGSASVGVGSGHGGTSGAAHVSRAAGVYAKAGEDRSYFLSADYEDTRQPHFSFTDENKTALELNDRISVRNVNAAWRSGGHSLLANVSESEQLYLGNQVSLASGGTRTHEKEMELVNYTYSFGPRWWSLRYSGTYDRQHRQIPRDAADGLRSDILGTRYVNALSAVVELPEPFTLQVGGAHEYRVASHYNNFVSSSQQVVADNAMDDRVVWEGSAFVQLSYDSDPWKLLAGTRYTHNQAFGDDFSSRGSAVYALDERQSLKLMVGQSFRTPMPFELYYKNNPTTIVGNPGLRPEKTWSAEASYLGGWDRVFGQATAYYEEYEHAIFRDLGDFTRDGQSLTGVNFYANAPRYHSVGTELELRYASPRTSAFAAFDYIHGSRGDEHAIAAPGFYGLPGGQSSNFKYAPRYTASAGASQSVANPFGSGDLFAGAVANHFSTMDTLRTRLPAQAWLDLSVGWRSGGFKHTLAVHNATGASVWVPEHVRQRVVESVPLVVGRRFDYTVSCRF